MARSITTRSTNPKIMDDNIKILDDAIDELVSNNEPILGTCTFDVTVAEGGYAQYVKSGNTVFVCYSFTISSGATNTSDIFSGLPKAKTISDFTFIPMFDDTTGVEKRCVIENTETGAKIVNKYGRPLENSGNYVGAFTYICE